MTRIEYAKHSLVDVLEVVCIIGITKLWQPRRTDCKLVESQHVQNTKIGVMEKIYC